MRIRKFNEGWKSKGHEEVDAYNIDELKDVCIILSDIGCHIKIDNDIHLDEQYNIEIEFPIKFSSHQIDKSNIYSIIVNRESNLENFTTFNNALNEVIQKIILLGYNISYVSNRMREDYCRVELRIGR